MDVVFLKCLICLVFFCCRSVGVKAALVSTCVSWVRGTVVWGAAIDSLRLHVAMTKLVMYVRSVHSQDYIHACFKRKNVSMLMYLL